MLETYLHEMHDRFGPDAFLAAYNAGPGRYEGYLERAGRFLKRRAATSPRSRP
jgi:soluble lytic murein transglycosylase-like protein